MIKWSSLDDIPFQSTAPLHGSHNKETNVNKKEIQIRAIEEKILLIRGHRVMLDYDLAKLYEVETKALKRAVKRNLDRFPRDFMFEVSRNEHSSLRARPGTSASSNLRYQFGTSSLGYGGRRYLPYALRKTASRC